MSPDIIKDKIRYVFNETFNKGNITALDSVFSPELIDYSVSTISEQDGLEGFKKRVSGYRTGFPDLRFTIDDMIVEGNYVAVRWMMSGTNKGPWLGHPATDKTMIMTGMNLEHFYNGKIVEHWSNPDVLSAMKQLGYFENKYF